MRGAYVITGSCRALTQAEMRYAEADWAEEKGDYRLALEWRAIVARMRKDWRPGGPRRGPNPDALVESIARPIIMHHDGPYDPTAVCPCGHWAAYLCDMPVGKGKTCDRPACDCCRHPVADGIDQCDFHARTEPIVAKMVATSEGSRTT